MDGNESAVVAIKLQDRIVGQGSGRIGMLVCGKYGSGS